MPATFDVLSIGSVYLDINSPNFPYKDAIPAETETVGGSYILTPGGSAMNFARVSSFLGLKTILIGKTGNDKIGEILLELIQQKGITPALIKSGAAQTNIGINFINSLGQVITTSTGTANQDLSSSEITAQLNAYLPQVKYLYLAGFFKLKQLINFYPEIIALAKKHKVQIVFDPGHTGNIATAQERNILFGLIRDIDIYLPNQEEMIDLWQGQDIELSIKKVRSLTGALIIVKQAEKGVIAQGQQGPIHVPSFPVAAISTVGAGDSFNAGLIRALINGMALQPALEFASATAAMAISQQTLPTTEKVNQFIASNTQPTPTPPPQSDSSRVGETPKN